MKIFDLISDAWQDLFRTPLGEMTAIHLFLLAIIAIVAFYAIKYIWKFLKGGLKVSGKGLRTLTPKHRCSKVQCNTCGRTLDKCVCSKNRKRTYVGRLMNYHSEKRAIKKRLKSMKK